MCRVEYYVCCTHICMCAYVNLVFIECAIGMYIIYIYTHLVAGDDSGIKRAALPRVLETVPIHT